MAARRVTPTLAGDGRGAAAVRSTAWQRIAALRINFFLLSLACKLALDAVYLNLIADAFAYAGLGANLSHGKMIESYLAVGAISLAISYLRPAPSSSLIGICFLLSIVPLMTIYAGQDQPRAFTYVALASFCIAVLLSRMPRLRTTTILLGNAAFLGINLALVVFVLAWLVAGGGLRFFNLNIFAVYEYRSAVGDALYIGPFMYLNVWATHVFNPMLFLWGVHNRRWILVAATAALQVLFFAILSGKDILFILPFVLAVYVLARAKWETTGLAVILLAIMGLGALENLLNGTDDVTFVITRRVLILPAAMAYTYHELFASIGHTYWSQGLLGTFVAYPFHDDPQRLVGEFLYHNSTTWANNGMFGAGYMNLGYAGMLIYGVLLGLWLYLVDCLTAGRMPRAVVVAVLVVPFSLVMTDGDLPTSLLTHGGILTTLMLWLWTGTLASANARTGADGRMARAGA